MFELGNMGCRRNLTPHDTLALKCLFKEITIAMQYDSLSLLSSNLIHLLDFDATDVNEHRECANYAFFVLLSKLTVGKVVIYSLKLMRHACI